MQAPFAVQEIEDGIAGPFRAPVNQAMSKENSIHNDEVAKKLGMRGGTIAGAIHLEQFPPLLGTVLGDRWFRTGSLSMYFRYATRDREEVRAFVARPRGDVEQGDVRTRIWMEDANGNLVGEGTASVGAPDTDSALRRKLASLPEPGEIRIFTSLEPGMTANGIPVRVTAKALDARLNVVTEDIPAYHDASIWGERIATPQMMVRAMRAAEQGWGPSGRDAGVGLYGAIELQYLDGPVRVERDYVVRGSILAVGETPKTEFYWYESTMTDADAGNDVASMIMMLRTMKASHPAWAE